MLTYQFINIHQRPEIRLYAVGYGGNPEYSESAFFFACKYSITYYFVFFSIFYWTDTFCDALFYCLFLPLTLFQRMIKQQNTTARYARFGV